MAAIIWILLGKTVIVQYIDLFFPSLSQASDGNGSKDHSSCICPSWWWVIQWHTCPPSNHLFIRGTTWQAKLELILNSIRTNESRRFIPLLDCLGISPTCSTFTLSWLDLPVLGMSTWALLMAPISDRPILVHQLEWVSSSLPPFLLAVWYWFFNHYIVWTIIGCEANEGTIYDSKYVHWLCSLWQCTVLCCIVLFSSS